MPLRSACLGPLETLRKQVEKQESVAHITQAEAGGRRRQFDAAVAKIEEAAKKAADEA